MSLLISYSRPGFTTGDHEFAVCPRHTAKTHRHTAKTSSTMADGKARTAATGTAKTLFAVYQMSGTRQTYSPCVYIGTRRKKASRHRHSQLTASAALRRVPAPWTHGKPIGFAVRPSGRHTANLQASPCARAAGTRRRMVTLPCAAFWHTAKYASRPAHTVTLPCAMATAHGKATEGTLVFFVFLGLKDHTPTYINTYITNNIQDIIYDNKHHKCNTKLLIHKLIQSTSPMQIHKCNRKSKSSMQIHKSDAKFTSP